MHARRHAPCRKGFTLIELLVVVAIIALLVSILLPALNGARRQTRQTLCATHLRNQGQAAAMYRDDNDGWLPCGIMSNMSAKSVEVPTPYVEFGLPHQAFLRYLGYMPPGDGARARKMKVENLYSLAFPPDQRQRLAEAYASMVDYQCPDFPLVVATGTHGRHVTSRGNLDYVVNAMPIPFSKRNARASLTNGGLEPDGDGAVMVQFGVADYYGLRKDSWVKRQGQFIYITEVHTSIIENHLTDDRGYNYRYHHFFLGSHLPFAGAPRIADDPRHPGGLNAVFFDGHAETLSPSQMDPGYPNSLAIRLLEFSDPSDLPPRFQ